MNTQQRNARVAATERVFPDPLIVCMQPKWENKTSTATATTSGNFRFWSDTHSRWITVPAQFETDFASVPYFARWYVDVVDPDILFPAIIHDYLYQIRGELPGLKLTRKQCDEVLRDAMLAIKAPNVKTFTVFKAVRFGGGFAWKS